MGTLTNGTQRHDAYVVSRPPAIRPTTPPVTLIAAYTPIVRFRGGPTAKVTGHTGTAGLYGLVNNAGFGLACPTELVQLEAFRRQPELNVTGQLAVTQAFLPSLRAHAAAS